MRFHLPPYAERWRLRGGGAARWLWHATSVLVVSAAAIVGAVVLVGNVFLGSDRDVPYRALDPKSEICRAALTQDVDILARREGPRVPKGGVGNDEWAALDVLGPDSRPRFSCAVQRHVIPGYRAADGTLRDISYDIAFVEFEESGKPYQVRVPCRPPRDCTGDGCGPPDRCRNEGYGPVQNGSRSQLNAVRDHLDPSRPNYVLGFIHGWRHNAEIGDSNVGDVRHYAAHVARFMEDRYGKDDPEKPHVTALYVGWRGARTDETWLRRSLGGSRLGETWMNDWLRQIAEWIGAFSALPTLFDRKPVSEAIAPAALSALRDIERRLDIAVPLPAAGGLPTEKLKNHMIVFGHSLGGNMLATALRDDLLKKVERHPGAGRYMLPTLGDLVVLINPASEASKWIEIQRAVWSRTPMSVSERAPIDDYASGQAFFRPEQRPIVVSVTAARDWPPGGRTEVDCDVGDEETKATLSKSRELVRASVEYDWATHDLFPAFKWDFRPVADTMIRWGSGRDPHDRCSTRVERVWTRELFGPPVIALATALRVLPFMRTDIEETRTIGHLDPVRAAQGGLKRDAFAARPLGTTHELRGWLKNEKAIDRKLCDPKTRADCTAPPREIPIDYVELTGADAGCPVARNWLGLARKARPEGRWASDSAGDNAPALRFLHGFYAAGISPITRPNDPFWNMRAFDTALARHDGFMLSSFICAMNQLVMDDITDFSAPAPSDRGRVKTD